MLARFAWEMGRLMGRDLSMLREQFLKTEEQEQRTLVFESLRRYGAVAADTSDEEINNLLEVFARNYRAAANYVPRRSEQRVVLFRAAETRRANDLTEEWKLWAGGGVDLHVVPGDHYTILTRPHVSAIAKLLQASLSRFV
jgi:thioesterase domain-containing protein